MCADDTDGKVGDSLEATREQSPTVSSPVAPFPVWGLSVAESSGPSGGKSDGGVVGEVTQLVGTPIHAHSLVVGRRFAGDPLLSCLLLHDPAGGACGIWWYRYDIARLTQGDCCRPATRTSAGTALVDSDKMRCVMYRMVAKLEIRDKGV